VTRPSIVIVGGGFSGTLLALHLIGELRDAANIHLVERGPAFGRGLAFSTRLPEHLLNVRAGNMSAHPDRPTHFQDWLADTTGKASDPFSFAPRWVYGDYLQGELRAVAQGPSAAGRFDLIQDEVVGVKRARGRPRVQLAVGRALDADVLVLAIGHGAATAPVGAKARFAGHPSYIVNPWAPGALDAIGRDDPILLLGTSLTAIDVIASLDGRGHRGRVLALSRRGRLPHRHARFSGDPTPWTVQPGEPLSKALARFRREADRADDWRRAFDGLGKGLERGHRVAALERLDRHVQHGEVVGHEEGVELGLLQFLNVALELRKVEVRVGRRARIAPSARMDAHRAHEGPELQLFHRAHQPSHGARAETQTGPRSK
jgi:uncharacterized NAD(P)/FAD-binding protein YdhS